MQSKAARILASKSRRFLSAESVQLVVVKTKRRGMVTGTGLSLRPKGFFVKQHIVASLLLVAMPGAPSSVLAPRTWQQPVFWHLDRCHEAVRVAVMGPRHHATIASARWPWELESALLTDVSGSPKTSSL